MRTTPYPAIASLAALLLSSSAARAQQHPPATQMKHARPTQPAETQAQHPLQGALGRATQTDLQFQTAVADADSAREDRVQARSSLLPGVSFTPQYLGNSPNGVNPSGR